MSPTRAAIEIGLAIATFVGVRAFVTALGIGFGGPIAVVCTLILVTLLLRRDGSNWRALGMRLPAGLGQWTMLPFLIIAAMAATFVLAVFLLPALTGVIPAGQAGTEAFAFLRGDIVVFLAFMLFVAWGTAAFGEEMLFRGFLLDRMETFFGGGRLALAAALLGQAVLFGLGHGYQGWYGIVLTGTIGLAMGLVYLAGRRWLLPVILAHGLIDTISLSQIYASG